ncbi:hypothetical protein AQPE_3309 [Aquipluma nitroreducens]|uniref:Cytochrome c domain-containing protein n=1 Tax=Aquipluma nitroreducens TaxID=2010828 RepID=A0A5K7SCD6_9BACT|nr:hypothetical protein [Aquipluma nitroreducens]BBE19135.1 hypothetical protein AQPE_3309 [Aquipluma nitroreducens]
MKQILLVLLFIGIWGCGQQKNNSQNLQNRIDSLELKLAESYKPGFGEFMSGIQAHHSKLWFAGQNQNWKLADFEIHEIMEAIEDIQKYETDRKESQLIKMINPAIDSINQAIKKEDPTLFKTNFTYLTNTCNACHRAANFEFNVVKIPDSLPFSNQDFKVNEQK